MGPQAGVRLSADHHAVLDAVDDLGHLPGLFLRGDIEAGSKFLVVHPACSAIHPLVGVPEIPGLVVDHAGVVLPIQPDQQGGDEQKAEKPAHGLRPKGGKQHGETFQRV